MIALLGGPLSRIERVALVTALALSAVLMFPLRVAVPDSTYAWLHVARHLSQGAGLVFNSGEHVYATTNPLWVTLLADGMTLGFDGLDLARVLGALSALLTIPLFLQLMRRTVRTPALRALGTLAWASHAVMARWAMSGIETPLAVALVLGGFVALTEGSDWGERPIRTGALWALAALTRPSAVLLLVLWGTALLIDAQNRPGLRRLVFGLLPVVAIYGSWLLFARITFGSFWPLVLSAAAPVNPSLGTWWGRLAGDFGGAVVTDSVIVLVGLLALVLGRPPAERQDRSALRLLPLAWIVLLPSLFAARGLDVSSRHLLLLIPVVHWLAWWAVDRAWSGTKNEPRAWVRATLVGTLVATVVVVQNLVAYRAMLRSESLRKELAAEQTLIGWGRWLRVNAKPGDVLVTRTPGALAYFGRVRVIDLSGHFTEFRSDSATHTTTPADEVQWIEDSDSSADFLVDQTERIRLGRGETAPRAALERIDARAGYSFFAIHWRDSDAETPAGP